MNKNKFFLLIVGLVLLSVGITLIFYQNYYIDDVRYINYTFFIGEKVGLTIDTDALHLGMMQPGGSSSREVMITNTYGHNVKVSIGIYGDKTEWMGVSESAFVLAKNANKTISFAVTPPDGAPNGEYNGYVKIAFKRASII